MHLVDRSIREKSRDERRLAEQGATKHRFRARKSCIADARSYRVARRLPVLAVAQFQRRNTQFPCIGVRGIVSAPQKTE
jgi:hypothetical protein